MFHMSKMMVFVLSLVVLAFVRVLLRQRERVKEILCQIDSGTGIDYKIVELGETHSRWALAPLTNFLTNGTPTQKSYAARGLGILGVRSANCIEALLNLFRSGNSEDRKVALNALTQLGWTPAEPDDVAKLQEIRRIDAALLQLEKERKDQTDRVHSWINHDDKKSLLANWDITDRVLWRDLGASDTFVTREAVIAAETLIRLGREESVESLVNLLNRGESLRRLPSLERDPTLASMDRLTASVDRIDRERLAEVFLNCGHKRLAAAAEAWAREHGYSIKRTSSSSRVNWGCL